MTSTAEAAVGTRVTASVAATSANLGPGFDCLGLAVDWRDESVATVVAQGFRVEVTGHGAGVLPTDEEHLVVDCVRRAVRSLGGTLPGLELRCHNTIPHGRGLGSSSAAIVSGLAVGWGLVRPAEPLDRAWALGLATQIEGHPDNVAAAVYGGLVLAFDEDGVQTAVVQVHPEVAGVVFIPQTEVATRTARRLLPATVPHAEAAADAGRAALLVHALRDDPDLLLPATRDWLHQSYRAPAMPESAALVATLRDRGYAAVISGAGPTVLVLGRRADVDALAPVAGFERRSVEVGGEAWVRTAAPQPS